MWASNYWADRYWNPWYWDNRAGASAPGYSGIVTTVDSIIIVDIID